MCAMLGHGEALGRREGGGAGKASGGVRALMNSKYGIANLQNGCCWVGTKSVQDRPGLCGSIQKRKKGLVFHHSLLK